MTKLLNMTQSIGSEYKPGLDEDHVIKTTELIDNVDIAKQVFGLVSGYQHNLVEAFLGWWWCSTQGRVVFVG